MSAPATAAITHPSWCDPGLCQRTPARPWGDHVSVPWKVPPVHPEGLWFEVWLVSTPPGPHLADIESGTEVVHIVVAMRSGLYLDNGDEEHVPIIMVNLRQAPGFAEVIDQLTVAALT